MSDNKMPSTVAEIFDGVLDESLLGLFILLLVVLLSTGYVYLQQQQAPTAAGAAGNAAAGARGGGRGARLPPNAAQTPANAIVTTNLSERQLLLHRALPSRNGARSITLCVDTLVTQAGDVVAWRSDAVPTLLTDLTQIGDVYLLAKVGSESDSERMDALRAFITQQAPGALKPHKLLFCSTTIGKIAFVRQIEPQLHIDVELQAAEELAKHVPRVVQVATVGASPSGATAYHVVDAIETYFALVEAMVKANSAQ